MFALIACTHFFTSCERLFQPALAKQPIIVLSSREGCVIERSNEAKALGIPVGTPYFKIKALCRQHKIHVFSSNYALYGDMSRRVMSIIEDSWPAVEIYSMDEAFLDLKTLPPTEYDAFCQQLQKKIVQYLGIPVFIGIGATKTLAKLASSIAKKKLKITVFNIDLQRFWLSKVPVTEVWGVERDWGKKLLQEGIHTAQDLANADWYWVRNHLPLSLQSTVMELRGIACLDLHGPEPGKSIVCSASLDSLQTEYDALAQSISGHCARAYEKLRQQCLVAAYLSVFIRTDRFRPDLPYYRSFVGFHLVQPTDDLTYLTRCANFCLHKIFRRGFHYQKVGVYLTDLSSKTKVQRDLLTEQSMGQLMIVLDAVNRKYGSNTLYVTAEGGIKLWSRKSEKRSPAYTTNWNEIPLVHC